jgi:4-hydroxy-3-polyprenylbenzoate decarboxylase
MQIDIDRRHIESLEAMRDTLLVERTPIDYLDFASPVAGMGSKMGIDATRKTREEGMMRDWPEEIFMSEEIRKLVDSRWKEYGL